ncbi:MAG: DNA/RNA nuclease SfsA [Gammaproteobacteria bacterium]|nr:DNA/RNA nuclease SfsA [Gammaproteobacteria bacterium]
MHYPQPLAAGRFLRRYKRFFADIETPGGIITAHCANTGSMRNCLGEGWTAWYSDVGPDTKRKLRYSLEQVQTPDGARIGLNTGLANALVAEAIRAGLLPGIPRDCELRREVAYGEEGSRIDLVADGCYIEVKSVTLREDDGRGYFPDARSERGIKHLRELARLARDGIPARLVYAVQHTGIASVRPAEHIDPAYGQALRAAASAGVHIQALGAEIDARGIRLVRAIPVELA